MASVLSQNEIDTLKEAITPGEAPVRRVGSSMGLKRTPDVRPYDFRHPAMLSKEQLRTLRQLHEAFARGFAGALSAFLGISTQIKCMGVDQISYGAYIQALPTPCPIVKLRVAPSGLALLVFHPAVASSILDRMTGGPGTPDLSPRFSVADHSLLSDSVHLAVRELVTAWHGSLSLSFSADQIESSTETIRVARDEKITVAVTLEATLGEARGLISLCYPFSALSSCVDTLDARQPGHDSRSEPEHKPAGFKGAIEQLPVKLGVRLGEARITMARLAKLKRGSVLILNRDTSQTVDVLLGDKVRYTGHLGSHNGHNAVLIQERLDNPEQKK